MGGGSRGAGAIRRGARASYSASESGGIIAKRLSHAVSSGGGGGGGGGGAGEDEAGASRAGSCKPARAGAAGRARDAARAEARSAAGGGSAGGGLSSVSGDADFGASANGVDARKAGGGAAAVAAGATGGAARELGGSAGCAGDTSGCSAAEDSACARPAARTAATRPPMAISAGGDATPPEGEARAGAAAGSGAGTAVGDSKTMSGSETRSATVCPEGGGSDMATTASGWRGRGDGGTSSSCAQLAAGFRWAGLFGAW